MLEKDKQAEESDEPLMCDLPDDLALLCIARVPRRFHHVLRCVSRRWRALLSSEEWHLCRRKNNVEEAWIYVMCTSFHGENFLYVLDPERQSWKRLRAIPSACLMREGMSFEALGKKLYLFGGCSWENDYADDVYFYDPSAEKWKEAARMPTARGFFLSVAVDDTAYVTTGLELGSGPKAWDIYDSQSNSWSSESNPTPIVDLVKFTSFDGKIYTFHKTLNNTHYARVYDPSIRKWDDVHNEIASYNCGPTVVVDGTVYTLDLTCGTRLMMWQKETEEWVPLGRLSQLLTKHPWHLAVIGRSIFVIGCGLCTVVLNVDQAANVEGMLVTSSFDPHIKGNFYCIGCTTIAI